MTTVYIDVYFFINLTVDILSAYFAARAVHIKTSVSRLFALGALGGILAILDLLFGSMLITRCIFLVFFLIASAKLISRDLGSIRRVRFVCALVCFEMLLGGGVYYGFLIFERYFSDYFEQSDSSNRRELIILSILILFVIGVLKLLIMVFGSERFINTVRIRIEIDGKKEELDALVDSGNLVRDPMNMFPVLFVKKGIASRLLPKNVVDLNNIDDLDHTFRKRIRLIPVTRNGDTHVMTGVRIDRVVVILPEGEEELKVTLAIDKDGGSFGGYDALLPSAVIRDGI